MRFWPPRFGGEMVGNIVWDLDVERKTTSRPFLHVSHGPQYVPLLLTRPNRIERT